MVAILEHERGIAPLRTTVDNIEAMRTEMSSKERGYLKSRSELRNPLHPAWNGIRNPEDAIIALERLSET